MKKFSVIIPITDSLVMGRTLAALRNQSVGLSGGEIILVGSDQPGLVECDQHVRFIQKDEPGFLAPHKRNLGMKLAEGAIFLFLDDDCVPRANWIEQHLYRQSQGESIVGGAVEFGRESYLQLADNLSAFHDLLPYTSPGYRTYLATANLSIHHSVVADIGEMDTSQIRSEDLEWTARMRSRGYKLYFDPSAVVYHDPNRYSLKPFIQHWVNDAPGTLRVRLRYSDLLGTPALARYRAAYLWGAPFVAGWATLRTFSHPLSVRRYWHTIPMVYLTKLIWCLSAFRNFPTNEIIE